MPRIDTKDGITTNVKELEWAIVRSPKIVMIDGIENTDTDGLVSKTKLPDDIRLGNEKEVRTKLFLISRDP